MLIRSNGLYGLIQPVYMRNYVNRGLRQENPLSPLLFVIIMEVLGRMAEAAVGGLSIRFLGGKCQ